MKMEVFDSSEVSLFAEQSERHRRILWSSGLFVWQL